MVRLQKIVSLINFGLIILFSLLSLLYSYIHVPDDLIWMGRTHPLFLHLPIGIFALYVLLYLFTKSEWSDDIKRIMHLSLSVGAALALVSAIAGLILMSEDTGEVSNTLYYHRIAASVFTVTLYGISVLGQNTNTIIYDILLVIASISLGLGGHLGASLTHGADFLTPSTGVDTTETLDLATASVFDLAIMPIVKAKCISCHNAEKHKNDLYMTNTTSLLKGGKNGPILVARSAMESMMYTYTMKPIDDKLHMPPSGKTQLTNEEKELIRAWIDNGASFSTTYASLAEDDTLKSLMMNIVTTVKPKQYTFTPAKEQDIEAINGNFVKLKPIYPGSPALEATFYIRDAFDANKLKSLASVSQQLVHLNLNNMPVGDADLIDINKFASLEKLWLNGTKITSNGISNLSGLTQLNKLSLANTTIDASLTPSIGKFKNLSALYLSNTKYTEKEIATLKQMYPKLTVYYEVYSADTSALMPPKIVNESEILNADETIELDGIMQDVVVRYTTDGSVPNEKSTAYSTPFTIDQLAIVNAVSYKDGWLPSSVASFNFFKKSIAVKSCTLHSKANEQYLGLGSTTIINGEKGPITNLKDQNWIAFREQNFDASFELSNDTPISTVAFAYGSQVPSYVFPPTKVSVFGSMDGKQFTPLASKATRTIGKSELGKISNDVVLLKFKPKTYKYYRVKAQNLPRIPDWHPGKGEKGWLFIDEIFFYQ